MKEASCLSGVVVDPIARRQFGAQIKLKNGKIAEIKPDDSVMSPFILPGMVDAHVHIESSMLTPLEFARAAAVQGTVAVVADPHEVANVAGVKGINFMVENAKLAPIKLFFGVPSCVPATPNDECAQVFTPEVIKKLIARDDMHFLGEMMNYPGVVANDEKVHKIIKLAADAKKPIDGHAPGLSGTGLKKYANAGITTDHECITLKEATDKIAMGIKILIREGSAAKNFNALSSLVSTNPQSVMFCTDDCHPDDLKNQHINKFLTMCSKLNYDLYDVLQATSVNPVQHYKLNVGLLQNGDPADFIIVDNLKNFKIISTYINGVDVLKLERTPQKITIPPYVFPKTLPMLKLELVAKKKRCKIIEVVKDELVTKVLYNIMPVNRPVNIDIDADLLKIVVLSRYKANEYSVALIKGVGLRRGAIAASIAHDSHHLIAIGTSHQAIEMCIEYLIKNKGGICYYDSRQLHGLPLPVFGLMTDLGVNEAAARYEEINHRVLADGCKLNAPFMTMAFMALTVIPNIKITPTGLFDSNKSKPIAMFT